MVSKLLGIIPTIQSVALAHDNLNFLNKKKKGSKDYAKQGVKNLVGVSLIGMTSKEINEFF